MYLSVPFLVAAATFSASAVRASIFEIASTVEAGQATTASISFDSDSDSFEYYTGLRIYLATTPPGWGTGPVCWLVNDTTLDTSGVEVDVTIPAAVVPNQSDLSLSYSLVDDEGDSTESFDYSNDFTLQGGTGNWSALELNGNSISSPDYCPCTALPCSRDCSDEYFPDGVMDTDDGSVSAATVLAWYDCLSACPGTTYPSYEDIYGDDGDDGDESSISAGLQTSTQTASANKASQTAASASATSSSTSTTSSPSTASATGSTSASTSIATSAGSRTDLTTTVLLMSCFGMVLWL